MWQTTPLRRRRPGNEATGYPGLACGHTTRPRDLLTSMISLLLIVFSLQAIAVDCRRGLPRQGYHQSAVRRNLRAVRGLVRWQEQPQSAITVCCVILLFVISVAKCDFTDPRTMEHPGNLGRCDRFLNRSQ